MLSSLMYQRMVVKHNTIANRTLTHDANTMIECVPFSSMGKIQPFLVSLSTNAALLMDFHCHLTKSEVSGYLAGYWDVNTHNLQISHAYPCRNTKGDRDRAPQVESSIAKAIEREKLTLVGWYHSHPVAPAAPTLRDVDAQLDYQIKMKGAMDNSYTPCIGIILSPYNYENGSLESSVIAYWVVPPPEAKPNEYGRPMLMSYSVVQDSVLSLHVRDEMTKCVDYYKKEPDFVNFSDRYLGNTTYVDKLKTTLVSKFPREESEISLWNFIRENLGLPAEEKEALLSIPTVSKTAHMLPSDISSILFSSGKFPSASSLLGLPDPMAHSTLAANNMFLQSNFFKMQELLNPLSSSSPIGKTKGEQTQGGKGAARADFSADLNLSKIPKEFSMTEYISSLSRSASGKQDYLAPDLGLGRPSGEYSWGEKGAKAADYSSAMLDLSIGKGSATESDMSTGGMGENDGGDAVEDKPLNLAGE